MRTKDPGYLYPEERKQAAYDVIDEYLVVYAPQEYRDYLKRMINDQIIAMKVPGFIGQTVAGFIYCEVDCHGYNTYNVSVPDTVLVPMKQALIEALEGGKQDGLQGKEEKEG